MCVLKLKMGLGIICKFHLFYCSECVNYALATSLILVVCAMVRAKQRKIGEICSEVIIDKSSDKTTMESIVEAQHSMKKVHEYVKTANVVILRLWSIVLARSPKVYMIAHYL